MHLTLIDVPEALVGPRVTLRAYRATDAAQILEAVAESRDHLRSWVNWVDAMTTIDDCGDYGIRCAARWMLRTDLSVGNFETASGRYPGGTGLHEPNWELRAFEIGCWIRRSAAG
jgi:RimJ/RimL family protein N-acetyltransferase